MNYIQSRPSKIDKWSYSFFLDFEGHADTLKIKNLLFIPKKHLSTPVISKCLLFFSKYGVSTEPKKPSEPNIRIFILYELISGK